MALPIRFFTDEYRWLSNFWPCEIKLPDFTFPSVENAYQAAKCRNPEHRRMFVHVTPGQAKRRGKKILCRLDWDFATRFEVMERLLIIKFRHPDLQQQLLATRGRELVEGNTWGDIFWGVCNGVGQNHMGRLLMKVRENIIREKLSLP